MAIPGIGGPITTASVVTHAFDFYYKAIMTGSLNAVDDWWDLPYDGGGDNAKTLDSFFNLMPNDQLSKAILTRHTQSQGVARDPIAAIPWGSPVTDLLWNAMNLSHSLALSSQTDGASYYRDVDHIFTPTSESFFYKHYKNSADVAGYGPSEYPVTSSWISYEPIIARYAGAGIKAPSTPYITRKVQNTLFPLVFYPSTLILPGIPGVASVAPIPGFSFYELPTDFTKPTPNAGAGSGPVGLNPTNVTYGSTSTGSNDGRFFDLAGGVGITREAVSASLVDYNDADNSAPGLLAKQTALKQRRLFFPTVSTSSVSSYINFPAGISSDNYNGWLFNATGLRSDQYFTENGGIYNVKFNIKRDIATDHYPDSGEGSELLIYIHRVNVETIASNPQPGDNGFYPPDANIIRIKNNPPLSFVNAATGYLMESYNINVIQYGTIAQLCFEASGSLSTENYFGCIIDDVEFCKVGVTTDPGLIKDETIGEQVERK